MTGGNSGGVRLPIVRSKRQCGACTECCTVLGVVELDKPQGQRCHHLRRRGCAVYTKRPGTCRGYACGWLLGIGTRKMRPDKIGVLLDSSEPDSAAARARGGKIMVVARELQRGAFERGPGKALMDALRCSDVHVRVRHDGHRQLAGPKQAVYEMLQALRGGDA